MKWLLLGASSFYAQEFGKLLQAKGESVEWNEPRWRMGMPLALGDRDYIVNFCSKSLVAESWEKPEDWCLVNLEDTTTLIRQCLDMNIRRFVHVSTPEVYGSTDTWVEENRLFMPTTPYAVSRAAGDMMMWAYHKARGFPVIITRTANIYGPSQQAYRLIPTATRKLMQGQKVELHGRGLTRRSWIHVKDACEGLYIAATRGDAGQCYHISTNFDMNVAGVVALICKYLVRNYTQSIVNVPDRLGKDHAYLLNSDKLRRMGWRDTITLESGIEEYVAWATTHRTA